MSAHKHAIEDALFSIAANRHAGYKACDARGIDDYEGELVVEIGYADREREFPQDRWSYRLLPSGHTRLAKLTGLQAPVSEEPVSAASSGMINLTPHAIVFHLVYDHRDIHSPTDLTFAPSGKVARLDESDEEAPAIAGMATCRRSHGDISGLPDPVPGIVYIVSAFCLSATTRQDVVAPDTGKSCIRTAEGKIEKVTRWLRPNQ